MLLKRPSPKRNRRSSPLTLTNWSRFASPNHEPRWNPWHSTESKTAQGFGAFLEKVSIA